YGVKGLIVQKYINNDLGLTKLEVSLYRMPDSVKAKKVYDLLGYNLNQIIYLSEDGYEGRIDTSLLFSYMLDLRKGRYYVRIIIDDKRPEAIETIKKFGDLVAHKIKPQEVL
ncbi:MAG: hypothetical protein ABIL05_05355, partial [candidate division WOR-3 bacterium]